MAKVFSILILSMVIIGCSKPNKFNYHKPKKLNIVLSLEDISKLSPDLIGIYLDYSKDGFLYKLIEKKGLAREDYGYFVLIDKPSPVFKNCVIEFEGSINKGAVVYCYPDYYRSLVWEP